MFVLWSSSLPFLVSFSSLTYSLAMKIVSFPLKNCCFQEWFHICSPKLFVLISLAGWNLACVVTWFHFKPTVFSVFVSPWLLLVAIYSLHSHRKTLIRKSSAGVATEEAVLTVKEKGLTSNYFVVAVLCSNRVTQHLVTDTHTGKICSVNEQGSKNRR